MRRHYIHGHTSVFFLIMNVGVRDKWEKLVSDIHEFPKYHTMRMHTWELLSQLSFAQFIYGRNRQFRSTTFAAYLLQRQLADSFQVEPPCCLVLLRQQSTCPFIGNIYSWMRSENVKEVSIKLVDYSSDPSRQGRAIEPRIVTSQIWPQLMNGARLPLDTFQDAVLENYAQLVHAKELILSHAQ